MKLFSEKKNLEETQMHGNRIASSEMISTYFVLCVAVRCVKIFAKCKGTEQSLLQQIAY